MQPMAKIYLDGAQRACTPADTLERMRPHCATAGISRIGLVTGMDRLGIPVAQSIRPDAVVLAVDSGKGFTSEQALVSAMMEGFERWRGESYFPETTAARDIADDDVVCAFPVVAGVPPSPSRVLCAPVHGIASDNEVWVPADVLLLQVIMPYWSRYFSSSSGLSAGNTVEEAIVGGLYEVIERDAVHLSMLADRTDRVAFTDDDPSWQPVRELTAKIEAAGCRWILTDVTGQTQVPTYVAHIYDLEDACCASVRGYGAHLSPAVAMCRAICEAAQARAVWMTGARDDIGQEKFANSRGHDARQAYDELAAVCDEIPASAREDRSSNSFAKDREIVVDSVVGAGLPEPLWVDLSPADMPLAVVRVVAPGLAGYFVPNIEWGRP